LAIPFKTNLPEVFKRLSIVPNRDMETSVFSDTMTPKSSYHCHLHTFPSS